MITTGIISGLLVYFILFHKYGYTTFQHKTASPIEDELRNIGKRTTVNFPAKDGTNIEGWLYMPNEENCPIVILAPGLASTKECFIETNAWAFVSKGIASLSIDFRTLGGSAGTPRHWVSPQRQAEDYLSTIDFVKNVLTKTYRIDPYKIAVWGSSFSGGVAVKLAAENPEIIKAVIAQVPYLKNSKNLEPKGFTMVRFVFLTMLDLLRAGISKRLPPIYITVFGKPNEFVFSKSEENISKYHKMSDEIKSPFWKEGLRPLRGGWENKMLARMFAEMGEYEPIKSVDKINQPIYLISATKDKEVLPEFIEEAYNRIPHKNKLITQLDCWHYDIYLGEVAMKNAENQASFLQNVFK